MSKPVRGTFRRWSLREFTIPQKELDKRFPDRGAKPMAIGGYVYDDPTGKWDDGQWVRTSFIVKLDYKNKRVETLNSIYYLK